MSQSNNSKQPSFIPQKPDYPARHNSPSEEEQAHMLKALGYSSLDAFIEAVLPPEIKAPPLGKIPPAATEAATLAELRSIASENKVFRSYIGTGYHPCHMPTVIDRAIFQNPAWYTAYTPYQAEISQGRLEALLNYQTMICDLTGLEIANASLLDEGSAAAEAMTMAHRIKQGASSPNTIFVSETLHPQSIAVIQTRAEPLGIQVRIGDHRNYTPDADTFAVLVQYPDTYGDIHDYGEFFQKAHNAGALGIVAADLLSLTLLRAPGEFGADIAVGTTQRFGLPVAFGGPHAAYLATKDAYKRQMPGRLVGVSKDAAGAPALRLALGTREQHIRREKATSNICTAQVLLAVLASMYAVYHGPKGLRAIASRIRDNTQTLSKILKLRGYQPNHAPVFDTLTLSDINAVDIHAASEKSGINLRRIDDRRLGISIDETTSPKELEALLSLFPEKTNSNPRETPLLPEKLQRRSDYLTAPVFNQYHTEHELLRYIKRLEAKDITLCQSMISLGSCTMKLTPTTGMQALSWAEFASIHPFAPETQTQGYRKLLSQLEDWLAEITGFAAVSLQPNSGASGEYAGLLAIRNYHHSRGETQRNIVLIPTSAHGTNPASAVMAGCQVIPVNCDSSGNIEIADLKAKAESHSANLFALMITYPSTHGAFESGVREICEIIHANGGQVYMDGANMNAQVGLSSPGFIGADVCHLNLHKTFAIPHGGGGPGIGPIGVAKHLVPHIPQHVSSAPYGSVLIATIPWAYIRMMGADGLRMATSLAILNANYIAARLAEHYPILFRGHNHLNAHELIIDIRPWKQHGVEVDDVAKRLMDFGYHAPTMSFPVPGTLMIEPTESESLVELDRFIGALIQIRQEIEDVVSGKIDSQDNPLKNAPHPASIVCASEWPHPYSREQAAFPSEWVKQNKYWPPVARIDNPYGDRNLVCSCQLWNP